MLLGMKELEPSRGTVGEMVVVTNPEAGRLLSDPDKLWLLCPFLSASYTVKEFAKLLGLTLNAAYLQVQRFYQAGLLEVVGERPRAGRVIKVYGASATAFFVPLRLLEGETRETLLGRIARLWEDKLVQGILRAEALDDRNCGVRVALGDEGKLVSGFVASPEGDSSDHIEQGMPAVFHMWLSLRLTEEVATSLQRDLDALNLKYRGLFDDTKGKPYVVRLAMAPHDEPGR